MLILSDLGPRPNPAQIAMTSLRAKCAAFLFANQACVTLSRNPAHISYL
jgi:hypothetical protein